MQDHLWVVLFLNGDRWELYDIAFSRSQARRWQKESNFKIRIRKFIAA